MVKISDSKLFYLQAFIIWAIVCLPGNIFTAVMLYIQHFPSVVNFVDSIQTSYENETGEFFEQSNNATPDLSSPLMSVLAEKDVEQLKIHQLASDTIVSFKNLSNFKSQPNEIVKKEEKSNLRNGTIIDPEKLAFANKHCYELLSDYGPMRNDFRFWVEGVAITVVGVIGLAGNFLAVLVLKDSPSSKSFDRLLISLAIWDSLLIVDMLIQKAIVGNFLMSEPHWFKVSYPYFWHPIKGMVKNGTIFMIVAVSAERYRAICHPLSKRQPPFNFIALVICMSITLDLPRFFHFELVDDQTEYWTSKLMENPVYIRFSSYWDGLITTGIVPLVALVIFNLNIYLKIRASSKIKYKFVGGIQHNSGRRAELRSGRRDTKLNDSITREFNGGDETRVESIRLSVVQMEDNNSPRCDFSRQSTLCKLTVNGKTVKPKMMTVSKDLISRAIDADNPDCIDLADSNERHSDLQVQPDDNGSEKQRNAFQRRREKSTFILVGIVILFIACHSYRLALKVYELAHPADVTMDHFNVCYYLGRHHVPVAIYVLQNLNYLFLVFNSSVNFVIYCCAGKEFRTKTARLFRRRPSSN